jgi:hypothetical protein
VTDEGLLAEIVDIHTCSGGTYEAPAGARDAAPAGASWSAVSEWNG